MVKYIEAITPTNTDEVLTTSLWWSTSFIEVNFNFSADRARELACLGLRTIGDLWNHDTSDFRTWEELAIIFPLSNIERHHWHFLINHYKKLVF